MKQRLQEIREEAEQTNSLSTAQYKEKELAYTQQVQQREEAIESFKKQLQEKDDELNALRIKYQSLEAKYNCFILGSGVDDLALPELHLIWQQQKRSLHIVEQQIQSVSVQTIFHFYLFHLYKRLSI